MWLVWAVIYVLFSVGAARTCQEATNPLTLVANQNAVRLSNGALYVMKEGLALSCVGGSDDVIQWQFWNQSREDWLDIDGDLRRMHIYGDTLTLNASTIATGSQWADEYSTLYRCVSISGQQLWISNAVYVKFPYYIAAARASHNHPYADCCLSCSQPGLEDEILKRNNNTVFTVRDLFSRQLLDGSRLRMVNELTACLGQRKPQEMRQFQVLEIRCLLPKENQIIRASRGYTLHSHKFTLRPGQSECEGQGPMPNIKDATSVWQESHYMECEMEASPNATLNVAEFGAVSGSYGYTWYYLSLNIKGVPSISVRKGSELSLQEFPNRSIISTTLCWMAEKSPQCRYVAVNLPVHQTTVTTTTVTTTTASTSTSTVITVGMTTNEQMKVKPPKPKTGGSKVERTGSSLPLKPSHIIAVSIGSCLIILVALLLLGLGVKEKCTMARRYRVVQTEQALAQN